MPNLIEMIQEIVKNTSESMSLADVLFGTVTSTSPLKIVVEQKMELSEEFLILTKNVKDYTVDVSVDWSTESKSLNADHGHSINGDISVNSKATVNPNPDNIAVNVNNEVTNRIQIEDVKIGLTHSHNINGKKTMTIHNALKNGDKVILLQQMGGQKFIVLDKV